MYRMKGTVIFQQEVVTIAKIELTAMDARTGKHEDLTIYTLYSEYEEYEARQLVERILIPLGYSFLSIKDVQLRKTGEDAEVLWETGIAK